MQTEQYAPQNPYKNKNNPRCSEEYRGFYMVGVAGFEPAASWTRTMRDTKLRHTPIDRNIIMTFRRNVKPWDENTYDYRNPY